jgi:hypothetical protein
MTNNCRSSVICFQQTAVIGRSAAKADLLAWIFSGAKTLIHLSSACGTTKVVPFQNGKGLWNCSIF